MISRLRLRRQIDFRQYRGSIEMSPTGLNRDVPLGRRLPDGASHDDDRRACPPLQLRLSSRQVKRLWKRYRQAGPSGLASRRRGRPSNRRTDPDLIERAVAIRQEHYPDFGPTFAAEKLLERDGIKIDHETLRRALIARGLWQSKALRKRTTHPPRERRPCFGELAQIDGSHHAWFEKRGPRCTLHVDVDDATTRLMALHFAEEETTHGYFELARQHALAYGLPLAFYADKHSIFRVNNPTDQDVQTQFGRAMEQLGIELICANSPQAKGRVERNGAPLRFRSAPKLITPIVNSKELDARPHLIRPAHPEKTRKPTTEHPWKHSLILRGRLY